MMQKNEKIDQQAIPDARRLVEAFQNSNLDSYDALKEFVDNSIDSGASQVSVLVSEYDKKNKPDLFNTIEIIDNGCGMSEQELSNAWKLGSNRNYKNSQHGKFGMGMTTATYRIAESIRIISTKDGIKFSTLYWELGYTDAGWGYKSYPSSEVEIEDFKNKVRGENNKAKLESLWFWDSTASGTLITLKILPEKIPTKYLSTLREKMRLFMGRTYSSFLKGQRLQAMDAGIQKLNKVNIYFNQKLVEPFDPFGVEHDVFYDSLNSGGLDTIPGARLRVIIVKDYPNDRSSKKITSEFRGFYCNRNGRYIVWADSSRFSLGTPHLLLRFELIWEPTADKNIGLTYNKNEVKFTEEQINEISRCIHSAKNKAVSLYHKANKPTIDDNLKETLAAKTQASVAIIAAAQSTGIVPKIEQIRHKEVRDRNGGVSNNTGCQSGSGSGRVRTPKNVVMANIQSKIEIVHEPLGSDEGFFCQRSENGKFIITINTSTRFFKTIYLPACLSSDTQQIDSLNLFIYSMAESQYRMERSGAFAIAQGGEQLISMISNTIETLIRNAELDIVNNITDDDIIENIDVSLNDSLPAENVLIN